MNYAEDRLDRRSRTAKLQMSDGVETGGEESSKSNKGLTYDLKRAHGILRSAYFCGIKGISEEINVEGGGRRRRRDILKDGHELAGRTVRDVGMCREASYHYAMAWTCDGDDAKCAGDYAQIAELTGYPELGALALLYYHAGGTLDESIVLRSASNPDVCSACTSLRESVVGWHGDGGMGCGCGMADCGKAPCHFPISMPSPVLDGVLRPLSVFGDWLDERRVGRGDGEMLEAQVSSAASILAQLSKNGKKMPAVVVPRMILGGDGDSCPLYHSACENIRFWEMQETETTSESFCARDGEDFNGGEGHSGVDVVETTTKYALRAEAAQASAIAPSASQRRRLLPPVLQLLLLKLLYSSPVGGPFLHLACESVAHISAAMPVSSPLGRAMARDYKSHWAYYVLIRAVVLGKRVKVHRRGTAIPYHVPVWDTVRGLDQRRLSEVMADDDGTHDTREKIGDVINGQNVESVKCNFTSQMHELIHACSRAISVDDVTNGIQPSSSRIPAPSVQPRCLPRVTSHPPLFLLGDSHVLSIGWQTLQIRRRHRSGGTGTAILRTVVPFPATGLKAWHTRPDTKFFTHHNLRTSLQRLPPNCRTILLSAGEIDCREGIGGKLLEGYYRNCNEAVRHTVREYVRAVEVLAEDHGVQILLMPVAPHAYRSEKNGKSTGRAMRRERMVLWNEELRKAVLSGDDDEEVENDGSAFHRRRVFLLDYEKGVRCKDESSPVGFVLDEVYNADFTHMNSAFLPLLEDAVERSSCNINLI